MKDNKKILVGALVLVALILGYAIVKQNILSNGWQSTGTTPTSATPGKSVPVVLSDDERKVLNTPGETATAEERKVHFDLAVKLAQQSPYVDIKECMVTPIVLSLPLTGSVTVRNQDTVDHEVVFDPEHRFVIPASGTLLVAVKSFAKGGGLYGYGCDTAPGAIGMVLVGN